MFMSPPVQLAYADIFTIEANSQHQTVGTPGQTSDGRKFRWAKAGATTLVVGNVLSAPTQNASQVDLVVNTALTIIGATQVTVTPGAAIVANQFQGGKLLTSNGAGIGILYTLGSHAAGNSSVNVIFTLIPGESVQVAANSVTRVDLLPPSYSGVVVNPHVTLTGYPVGVAVAPITNGQFGWIQTHGLGGVLMDATAPAQGVSVCASVATDGAAGATCNSTAYIPSSVPIGYMAEAGVSAKVKGVYLNIE